MSTSDQSAVRFRDISKRYGSTQALDAVSFAVARGSIHGLLGGNGSGKSTLIKILAGVEAADSGTIETHADEINASQTSPRWAREKQIHFVHQDFGIFSDMTVTENLSIGRGFEQRSSGSIDWRAARHRATRVLDQFDIHAGPDAFVKSLSPASHTLLAIARTLQDQDEHGGVLVLDEPTVALPDNEVESLLTSLRRFADGGQTIVFVSHRLGEVFAVTDTVTILRDGKHIDTMPTARLTRESLIEMIAGEAVAHTGSGVGRSRRPDATSRRGSFAVDQLGGGKLEDISFEQERGTVVGFAGLLGSGRSSLLKLIGGVLPLRTGTVRLDYQVVRLERQNDALDRGIVYVPEDRAADGLFLDQAIGMNLNAARLSRFAAFGWLSHRAERAAARADLVRFGIKAAGEGAPLASLSGGNQQKVLLGRWISLAPKVLLLDEPTKGVDVKSRSDIYDQIHLLVDDGCYVLVASSDFEELNLLCDRVLVLDGGRIKGEVPGHQSSALPLTRALHHIQLERRVT